MRKPDGPGFHLVLVGPDARGGVAARGGRLRRDKAVEGRERSPVPKHSRVGTLFRIVRDYAALKVPWLSKVKPVFCTIADGYHKKKWRFFAHSGHLDVYTVCFAKAAERELTDEEVLGISTHELGHVVAIKDGWPEHATATGRSAKVESEADRIARHVLGFRNLRYNLRTLQELR